MTTQQEFKKYQLTNFSKQLKRCSVTKRCN